MMFIDVQFPRAKIHRLNQDVQQWMTGKKYGPSCRTSDSQM